MSTNNKLLYGSCILIGILTALYFLGSVLTPFLVGALLAYLVDPLVNRLMRLRIPRLLAVVIVFVFLFLSIMAIVLLCIPLIEKQLIIFVNAIPDIAAWLQNTVMAWLDMHFGIGDWMSVDQLKVTVSDNLSKAGGLLSGVFKTLLHSSATVVAWVTNLILIPVVTFYLLRDWDALIVGCRKLLPRSIERQTVNIIKECDSVLSAFFRGQLLVMLSLGVIYSLGLTLIGLPVGLMIGLISGLVSIVPYLGFIIGIITASIVAFVQFDAWMPVFWVWLVFGTGQMIESSFLTPYFIGDRIGLHPVAVIFAILAGGTLYGFFGVLLALPVAAVLMVIIRFFYQRYRKSELYQ